MIELKIATITSQGEDVFHNLCGHNKDENQCVFHDKIWAPIVGSKKLELALKMVISQKSLQLYIIQYVSDIVRSKW